MSSINTITKETSIKHSISSANGVTTEYKLPSFQPEKIIFRDPSSLNRGFNSIPLTQLNWLQISPSFDTTFYEIVSRTGKMFYIKVETTENSFYTKQTSMDCYNNANLPVRISIANGSFDYDASLDVFTTNETSELIVVDFILLNQNVAS